MERRIFAALQDWKTSPSRKPLLLFGARQVGKTYALRDFGARLYENVAFIDFARDARAADIFEGSLDPQALVAQIGAYLRMDIDPAKTLIVFDEVQLCERALTALKYFCDDAPTYHVAAAGSLLGVKLRREQALFPVGKVDMLALHPLGFDEFLAALGEGRLAALIQESLATNQSLGLHERALELYREYLLVGGMPEVVDAFVSSGAGPAPLDHVRSKQLEIDQAYLADIAKYAPIGDMPRISEAWASVPAQLAKENRKFQYKAIRSGARASQYEGALAWLVSTGTVTRCFRVGEGTAPLATFEDRASFKLYKVDTGLLSASYQALPEDVQPSDDKAARFRGALAENYVMQQLVSHDVLPHYWGTASRAEVEFVVRDREGNVVPIEVKSGTNVRSSSLGVYRRAYEPRYAVRISTRNFGFEGGIRSVPLYAACYLADELMGAGPMAGFVG